MQKLRERRKQFTTKIDMAKKNDFMFENDQEIFLGDAGKVPTRKGKQNEDYETVVKEKDDKYDTSGLTKAQKCEMFLPSCTQSRYWQITIIGTLLSGG